MMTNLTTYNLEHVETENGSYSKMTAVANGVWMLTMDAEERIEELEKALAEAIVKLMEYEDDINPENSA